MTHATLKKFGAPDTLIHEYEYWSVVLRPKQTTLGSLVLISRTQAQAFSDLEAPAFAELQKAVADTEKTLATLFSYNKINYLMLMMVDPHVHFHVLPRYNAEKIFNAISFKDPAWPGPPDLSYETILNAEQTEILLKHIQQSWPS